MIHLLQGPASPALGTCWYSYLKLCCSIALLTLQNVQDSIQLLASGFLLLPTLVFLAHEEFTPSSGVNSDEVTMKPANLLLWPGPHSLRVYVTSTAPSATVSQFLPGKVGRLHYLHGQALALGVWL